MLFTTDLDGVTAVDPSPEEWAALLDQLEQVAEEYDFPEVIFSHASGAALLVSPGFKVVYEKGETELGLMREVSREQVIKFVKLLQRDQLEELKSEKWELA